MIFNQFELARVARECQDELFALLNTLGVEHDPVRFGENYYLSNLNESIDTRFSSLLNNDNIVIGLKRVARLADSSLGSLTVDEYIHYIVANQSQIKEAWKQKTL